MDSSRGSDRRAPTELPSHLDEFHEPTQRACAKELAMVLQLGEGLEPRTRLPGR
jgi:hypothetical protein